MLPRILGDQIILAQAEKPLAIIPVCADQWNAAGKRFENPDGWDARKRLNIKSAGYMDSRQPPGKNSRSHRVGNQAMIAGARQAKSHPGMGGITHAPNVQAQTGRLAWDKQIIAQSRAALVLAPLDHPTDPIPFGFLFGWSEEIP